MEQTNLVVTPDGKTWDEVTRDTSYIGRGCLFVSDDNADWNTSASWSELRGIATGTNYDCFIKDFAQADTIFICLKDGQYRIGYATQQHTSGSSASYIRVNGTVCAIIRASASGGTDAHYSGYAQVIKTLKRGDYIGTSGERNMGNNPIVYGLSLIHI